MEHSVETEYKFMFDECEYNQILEVCEHEFTAKQMFTQVNYYYDTLDGEYSRNETTVRVRQKKNDIKLQIKIHNDKKSGYRISDEYEMQLLTLPKNFEYPGTNNIVYLRGQLVTERRKYYLKSIGTICIDCNMYLGVCDYELEIEFENYNLNNVNSWITQFKGLMVSRCGKADRFFNRLNEF